MDGNMHVQVRSTFPLVKKRQMCHFNEDEGYMPGYVSLVFDGGFVVRRNDGSEIRVLETGWTNEDAARFVWLKRNGKPIKKHWWTR